MEVISKFICLIINLLALATITKLFTNVLRVYFSCGIAQTNF